MMTAKWTGVVIGLLALAGCVSYRSTSGLPVVKDFDAARYMGLWHEIARLPQWFERGLHDVTATYSLDGDTLRIVNRGTRNGEDVVSTAVGHFAGPPNEGAFRVSFFRPFYGDYRILWLSDDYDEALVTSGDRSGLWILARKKPMPKERQAALLAKAREWGYDIGALEYPR